MHKQQMTLVPGKIDRKSAFGAKSIGDLNDDETALRRKDCAVAFE